MRVALVELPQREGVDFPVAKDLGESEVDLQVLAGGTVSIGELVSGLVVIGSMELLSRLWELVALGRRAEIRARHQDLGGSGPLEQEGSP